MEPKQSPHLGSGSIQSLEASGRTISITSSKFAVETRSFGKPSEVSEVSMSTGIAESILTSILGTGVPKFLPTAVYKSIESSLMQSKAPGTSSQQPAPVSATSSKYQLSDYTPSVSVPKGPSETRISSVESLLNSKAQGEGASRLPSFSRSPIVTESILPAMSSRLVSVTGQATTAQKQHEGLLAWLLLQLVHPTTP
jgi:hypothetical protein